MVQNSAARLILQCRNQNHTSPLLMSLHWLPIKPFLVLPPIYLSDLLSVYTPKIINNNLGLSSIYLSDLLSVYTPKIIYNNVGLSSIYLSDLLSVYTPKINLRSSSDNGIPCISKLRTKTLGHRTFSLAAHTI